MARMDPESKITGKKSLRTVGSSLVYTPIPQTNEVFYEAVAGPLDGEGASG